MLKSYVFKRREKNQAEKKCADLAIRDFQSLGKTKLPRGPGASTQGESNPGQKSLRVRNSPTCTLSQNGYGKTLILRFGSPRKGCGRYDIYNIYYEAARSARFVWFVTKQMRCFASASLLRVSFDAKYRREPDAISIAKQLCTRSTC